MKTITVRAANTRGWLAVIITKITTLIEYQNNNNKENIIAITKRYNNNEKNHCTGSGHKRLVGRIIIDNKNNI